MLFHEHSHAPDFILLEREAYGQCCYHVFCVPPVLQAAPGVQTNFSSKSEGSRDHFLAGELGGGGQGWEGHLLFILYPFKLFELITMWVNYLLKNLIKFFFFS